jgi:hypothetical protein
MTSPAVSLAIAGRVAGHETAERRRRLGLTRRALAGASGVGPARLAAHEDGRIALDSEELRAIDGVLSPQEMKLGLPSVRLEYVPASTASGERDEHIRRDVLHILFAGDSRPRAAAETPPSEQQKGAGRTNPTPSDVDPHLPDQRLMSCLPPV